MIVFGVVLKVQLNEGLGNFQIFSELSVRLAHLFLQRSTLKGEVCE